MNLRKAENYSIGLDLGSSSVGWAVVDEEGKLYHIKGKPTWGSRLFPEASTAAERRLKRGQRRRYERRRQRLDQLQEFFLPEMRKVDPEFFIRMRQSRLLKEDRNRTCETEYRSPFFNASDFTESRYYDTYPTIYHLRQSLMHSTEKADLRLIYLALHNIVKYRGNFLHEDEGTKLKASNADARSAVMELMDALLEYAPEMAQTEDEGECSFAFDPDAVCLAIEAPGMARDERREAFAEAVGGKDKPSVAIAKLVSKACFGYRTRFDQLLAGVATDESSNFSVSSEEKVEEFVNGICPDEALRLFNAIQKVYSAYVLSGILSGHTSLSDAMVDSYNRHHSDLVALKGLVRDYLGSDVYASLFRGPKDDKGDYDINALPKGSYTAYIAGEKKANGKGCTHDDLLANIRKLCKQSEQLQKDSRYKAIEGRLFAEDSDFLKKQKTRDNGTIPYQLHLEEMDTIIDAQGKFYPFLLLHKTEMEALVKSRIPYYVGPLAGEKSKFGWAVRREGMETAKAFPWNVDEVFDADKTAELFIQRMTGTCTYLFDEPVLPRHSLLYEEFCVYNELNGARWGQGNQKPHRFDHEDRRRIFNELFKTRATVSYRAIQEWFRRECGIADVQISGAQAETGFESKLESYRFFCKLFGVDSLEDKAPLTLDEMEEIILWSTVFEDRNILHRKLDKKYGFEGNASLTEEQIKKIVNKRFTGWGRLSRKLLLGVRVLAPVAGNRVSVMDVLRDGNPYHNLRTSTLMEVLTNRELSFQIEIDRINEEHLKEDHRGLSIDDMQGSPQNRRAVNQAMRILDELIGIAGKPPARICIEVTRDDDLKKRGKRTNTRYHQLKEALNAFKRDKELMDDLEERKNDLDDDRLMLYFEQFGRCMYSGDKLDINQLGSPAYQIDHIVPQSLIKDDSLSNRVLVKAAYNQRKLDGPLADEIVKARKAWWGELLRAKLISQKKYDNLTRRSFSDGEITGFINRQLVETSQVVKFVRQMCEQKYPGTDVISVRASVSHGVRENYGFVKSRELNNYHHAHDAFLACQVADFVDRCFPQWQDGFNLAKIRSFVKERMGGYTPGSRLPGRSGYIAYRLTYDYVDEHTGEILWCAEERETSMRKALGYKDCFISRMTEEQTGAFWDETVYSPRDGRNAKGLNTPLKSSSRHNSFEGMLDPQKYGGVSSVKQAHWFIFAAKNKKGNYKYFFEGVPIHLSAQMDGQALQLYADQIATKAGCGKATILRSRVPLRQKLEIDGIPYYLYGGAGGGKNEVRSAREMNGSSIVATSLNKVFLNEASREDLLCIYDWLVCALPFTWPWLSEYADLEGRRDSFLSLSNDEELKIIKTILMKANGVTQNLDMSLIGGKSTGGRHVIGMTTGVTAISWIDQSVTGIFEKRTTFEDLTRGL